jgi:hypothetical protein
MKKCFVLLIAAVLLAQKYTLDSTGTIIARPSFLNSSYPHNGGNIFRDPSLLIWYMMRPTTNQPVAFNVLPDLSGNYYDAKWYGSNYPSAVGGKLSPLTYVFNHSYQNVVDSDNQPTVPSTFTATAWVKPTAFTPAGYIRIIENDFATSFYLGTNSNSTHWAALAANSAGNTCTGTSTPPLNVWSMVSMTYDGTTEKLYVNGALENSCTQSATTISGSLAKSTVAATAIVAGQNYSIAAVGTTSFTSIGASANTAGTLFTATASGTGTGTAYPMFSATPKTIAVGGCAIGSYCSGGVNYWTGSIQDVQIYTRVFAAADILTLFNATNI